MSTIRADLQLNCQAFLDGVKRAGSSIQSFKRDIALGLLALKGFSEIFQGFGAITDGFKKALDLGGHLSDLAAMSGASAGEMAILQQAIVNAGMSAASVISVVGKFQKALGGVNEDGQTTADVFSKLGINTLALSNMSLPDQFETLSRAFQRIEDPAMRAKLAMDLFGRSGVELLPLLRDSSAFSTAATQIGGLAGVMDQAANKFDTLSDSLGALGVKTDQFFAAFANALTSGDGLAATLDQIDLTEWGERAGEAAMALVQALSAATQAAIALAPVFAGILGQMLVMRVNAAAAGGVFTRIFSMSIPAAIGQTRVQMALFGMSIKQQGINLITLRGVATTAFAGIAGAAKVAGRGIVSAFGPVGLILMAATETLGFFMKKMQQATDTAKAMNGMVKGFIKDVNRNNTSIRTVSNEEERGNVKSDIEQQIESTSEALANADEDYAHLGKEGLEEAKTRLERHLRLLEKQRESLANLSPEIIKANAAERERQKLLAESAKEAANLSRELESALKASDKASEKRAIAAMSPGQAESSLLNKVGISSREGFSGAIASLRGLGAGASVEQKRRLLELLAINEQLLEVDGRREEEQRKIAAANAKASETAAKAATMYSQLEKEAGVMAAVAGGDTDQAKILDRDLRASRMAQNLISQGMPEKEAQSLAMAQTRLADLSDKAIPQSILSATKSREIGLGGRAVSNSVDIARIQAERQREANGLLKEIKEILRKASTTSSSREWVFS